MWAHTHHRLAFSSSYLLANNITKEWIRSLLSEIHSARSIASDWWSYPRLQTGSKRATERALIYPNDDRVKRALGLRFRLTLIRKRRTANLSYQSYQWTHIFAADRFSPTEKISFIRQATSENGPCFRIFASLYLCTNCRAVGLSLVV